MDKSAGSPKTERPKILVVDDDVDVREVVLACLADSPYEIIEAGNGMEALEKLKAHKHIDVLVTDIRMPGMTGLELFNQTKSCDFPTIFISGFADTLDLKKALEIGASDFLNKPFTQEELINSIEVALHSSKTAKLDKEEIDEQYCRVSIDEFLSGSKVSQDVFIGLSDHKYLRVARSDSPLSMERVRAYQAKGLRFLFIKREDFARYVDFNLSLAQAASSSKVRIPKERKLQLLKQTSGLYLENLRVNGVDKDSYEEGKTLVETSIRMLSESDDLFTLLEMLKSHSDADYAHSLAVSLYSTMISKALGWNSQPTLFKISMAGLLHDIGKKELPADLVKKRSESRLSMTSAEIQLYQTHPIKGRDLLVQIPCVPEEVPIAVAQHHENMAGFGYPYRPSRLKLHPFSRILNIADEFCHLMLTHEGPRKDYTAEKAMKELFDNREAEFDPHMMKALFTLLKLPIPKKLVNLRAHNE